MTATPLRDKNCSPNGSPDGSCLPSTRRDLQESRRVPLSPSVGHESNQLSKRSGCENRRCMLNNGKRAVRADRRGAPPRKSIWIPFLSLYSFPSRPYRGGSHCSRRSPPVQGGWGTAAIEAEPEKSWRGLAIR